MLKSEEEVLYKSKSRSNSESPTQCRYKNIDKGRSHRGTQNLPWRAQKNDNRSTRGKRFEGICYNCGRKGHMSKKKSCRKKQYDNLRKWPLIFQNLRSIGHHMSWALGKSNSGGGVNIQYSWPLNLPILKDTRLLLNASWKLPLLKDIWQCSIILRHSRLE